jgi:ATP-dependent exoDNAse (exonuclease V) alpha subunit
MRICKEKSTGKILEMQSDATEGTLIQNAVNAGYVAADVEEKVITNAEWATLNAPSQEEIDAQVARAARLAVLDSKLTDDSITFDEMKELLRLRRS